MHWAEGKSENSSTRVLISQGTQLSSLKSRTKRKLKMGLYSENSSIITLKWR